MYYTYIVYIKYIKYYPSTHPLGATAQGDPEGGQGSPRAVAPRGWMGGLNIIIVSFIISVLRLWYAVMYCNYVLRRKVLFKL
jgi:hypothetical protein